MVTVLLVNKKLTILILSICTTSLLAILYLNFKKRDIITPDSYKEAMTYVKKIPLSEVQEKINNKEDFILYIGRESCPYCQKFAPKLAVAIQKTNQTVYYLDNDSKERKDITAFAHDMNVKTVPNLSTFKKGSKENYLKKGSKSSIEEIMDLLTQ
jgi:possible thiol-disulfide isomerase and thioredoxin